MSAKAIEAMGNKTNAAVAQSIRRPKLMDETDSKKSGGRDSADNLQSMSRQALKDAEESMAMLRSGAEKVAANSLNAWSSASEESKSYVAAMMEAAYSTAASAATLAKDLADVKRPSDLIAVANAHAHRQMEMIIAQNRKLWGSAQKLASAASVPERRPH